ncbi:SDR family NAD(P)-dependent oxidoreductase [Streptomyces sp. NPDC008265]|uniref:SDR family NAD(P)-dependent oxidoreductase n=1 Tax=Streptomyces sp. NPDC008265 TaxID=3364824 RepID=UPI0036E96196
MNPHPALNPGHPTENHPGHTSENAHHPVLRDTDIATAATDIARQLLADDDEDLVAWRHGVRYAARLDSTPVSSDDLRTALCPPDATSLAYDGTHFTRVPDPVLAENAVAVTVTATCPSPPALTLPLVAVAGTTAQPAVYPTPVVALIPAGPTVSRVAADRRWTLPVATTQRTVAIAASLLPYLAAHLSVHRLAQITAGQKVLIRGRQTPILTALHNTAAAAGARVFHERQFTAAVQGQEAAAWDVILDALADGSPYPAGHTLNPGGRHIVIADSSEVLLPERRNTLSCRLDLPAIIDEDPEFFTETLASVADALAEGRLPLLPHTTVTLTEDLGDEADVEPALARLWPTESVRARIPAYPNQLVRRDGAYLITGGLGGLGLEIARWLTRHRAGTIILNSRSQPSPEARAIMAGLRQDGCTVEAISADLAEPGSAEALCAAAERHGHQLRGIIHAAAVVDDAAIVNISPELLARVWRPKATGAWLLHHASTAYDLDWWVAFSSFVPQAGSPGQSAYAAASAWLDELVAHRRAMGLPALGINWGAWAEVGIGARTIGARGFETIPLADAFEGLELLLGHDRPRSGFVTIDLPRWLDPYPQTATLPFFKGMLGSRGQRIETDGRGTKAAEIIGAPTGKRSGLLTAFITEQAADVLRCSPTRIGPHTSLTAIGMDSMITVQLRNRLQKAFDITIPRVILWTKPTVTALRDYVLDHLPTAGATPHATTGHATVDD